MQVVKYEEIKKKRNENKNKLDFSKLEIRYSVQDEIR